MMKISGLFLILNLLGTYCLWGQAHVGGEEGRPGKKLVLEGALPVYEVGGKTCVLIEEACLGREWMVFAQIDKGCGMRGRLLPSRRFFTLEAGKDGQLEVYHVLEPEQVTDTALLDRRLLERTGLKTVQAVWEVVARTGEGYLVDVSDFLKGTGEWYDSDGEWGMADRSRSEVVGAFAFGEGVRFVVRHQVARNPEQGAVEMVPEKGGVPVEMSVVFCRVPESAGIPVVADAGSLFRTQACMDYGMNPLRGVKCSRAVHWDIPGDEPLRVQVDAGIPRVYAEALRVAAGRLAEKLAAIRCRPLVELVWKDTPLCMADRCGVLWAGGKQGVEAECLEHPGDGRILLGRLYLGCPELEEQVVHWQLTHLCRDKEGRWSLCPYGDARREFLAGEMERGLLALLGMEDEKIRECGEDGGVLASLKYVYTGERSLGRVSAVPPVQGTWERHAELRDARREVLEHLSPEVARRYYKGCVGLMEEEYIRLLSVEKWREGDFLQLCRMLAEEAAGFYETPFIRRNMFGEDAGAVVPRLQRVWQAFFNRERWLQWMRGGGGGEGGEGLCTLEQELCRLLDDRQWQEEAASGWMTVQHVCVEAFCSELKALRESVTHGSGVAGHRLLASWETVYRCWKKQLEDNTRHAGKHPLAWHWRALLKKME